MLTGGASCTTSVYPGRPPTKYLFSLRQSQLYKGFEYIGKQLGTYAVDSCDPLHVFANLERHLGLLVQIVN